MKMQIIYRSIDKVEVEPESRNISGRACVFNSWSRDLGGFQEIIRSSSISEDLLSNSDIIMNVNHDDDKMVARWNNGNGTLKLELRDDGLYFNFDAPPTPLGDELLYNVRSGNLFECSFAFGLDPNDDSCQRWYRENGQIKREINKIGGLFDCSIVTRAAYPAANCRGLEIEKIDVNEKIKSFDEEERKLQDAKDAELLAKYEKMEQEMNKFL